MTWIRLKILSGKSRSPGTTYLESQAAGPDVETSEESQRKCVESLFECWGPSLLRYALRSTGSRELAEDLVQETFMTLYCNLRHGKRIVNLKGWTLIVLRRQIARHGRKQRRHGEVLVPPEALDAMPCPDLWTQHAASELSDVTRLFSVLTPREEEVILLRLQGLRYREIASELGISSKSVGTLLMRALRKLQRRATEKSTEGRISIQVEEDVCKTLQ